MAFVNDNTFDADHIAKFTIAGGLAADANYTLVLLRGAKDGTASSFQGYELVSDGASGAGHTEVYKWVNGGATVLGNFTATFTTGNLFEGRIQGTLISLYKNSAFVASLTDSTFSRAGAPGLGVFNAGANTVLMDDFVGDNVAGPIVLTYLGLFEPELSASALFDATNSTTNALFDETLVAARGIVLAVPNALAGTSTVSSFVPKRIQTPATVTLAGVSTVSSFTPVRVLRFVTGVTLAGSSTLNTPTAIRVQIPASVTLVGTSTLSGAARIIIGEHVTLAGVSTVSSFTPKRIQTPALVTLAGTSTVSSFTPKRIQTPASVTLAGTSTLTGRAYRIEKLTANVTLAGTSTLAATITRIEKLTANVTLAGTSTVSSFVPKRVQIPATVTLVGTSTVSSFVPKRIQIPASVTLAGSSTLTGAAREVHWMHMATLVGTSTVNGSMAGGGTVLASGSVAGSSAITGRAYRIQTPVTVTVAGGSSIANRAYRIQSEPSVALAGTCTISGSARLNIRGFPLAIHGSSDISCSLSGAPPSPLIKVRVQAFLDTSVSSLDNRTSVSATIFKTDFV
jgi:hypothetical protein